MIDTYFDRADAATGYRPKTCAPSYEDPRNFGGQIYNTMIDRNVAEARYELARFIAKRCIEEKQAMARRVKPFTLDFGRQLPSFNLRIRKAYSKEWLMTLTDCRTSSTLMTFDLQPGLYVIEIRVPFFHSYLWMFNTQYQDRLDVILDPHA